jgi:hypothetical protein
MRVHFLSIQSEDELFLKQVSQFFIQQLDLVVSVLQLWPKSTKNLYSAWQGSSAVAGTTYAVSDNGWMQTNVFVSWFDTFLRQVKERPFLLVFDGHRTHIGLDLIKCAKDNNVSLLKLPSHTTHCLQPLDMGSSFAAVSTDEWISPSAKKRIRRYSLQCVEKGPFCG